MKKVLVILGIVGVSVISLILIVLFVAFRMIHKAEGPALYSSMGAWTRIQEYAHAQGKTNYIAFADQQVADIQTMVGEWQRNLGSQELADLQKKQAEAYAQTDKNIKSGQNPLAFLDETNHP
ncbi:MAG TPA: hypothetical protein VMH87_15290 [Pseudomonadales bacterium]|nr:hypothetical protein [Pseudomonadales bacterium]